MDTTKRLISKLLIVGIGLLMLAGIVTMTRIFIRGFTAGAVIGVIACIIVLIWMSRALRSRRE